MNVEKNNVALTRTSAFRENRKKNLAESGYAYYCGDKDLKKEVSANNTLVDESLNADSTVETIDCAALISPDIIDHNENVEQDEYEHRPHKTFSDRHGMYVPENLIAYLDLVSTAFQALRVAHEKKIVLEEAVSAQAQQIAELKPKAAYFDVVLKCKDAVNISVIAKDYGWSAQRMNEYLHQKGVQYKQAGIWLLYQKHSGCGYTKTNSYVYQDAYGREHTKILTKWTQKGRLFIYEILKANGVYPQIEKED